MLIINPQGGIDLAEPHLLESRNLSYTATNLFDALFEMFPELSKTEVRRLVKGGAMKGYLDRTYTYEDVENCTIEPDTRFDMAMVILGKTQGLGYRWGIIVLNPFLRDLLVSYEIKSRRVVSV